MSVLIGHASISEKGTINGAKGDSTGKEVCVRTWYNKPWDFMAIHPDAGVRERHAQAVEDACNNNNIGYGQGDRNSANAEAKKVGYVINNIKTKCNTDCSALQNLCAVAAKTPNVTYGSNGWTTSVMKARLQAAGYIIIEASKYISNEKYCVRGAIYVKAASHTVCGLTNGTNYLDTLKAAGLSTTGTPVPTTPAKPKVDNSKIDSAKKMNKNLAGSYIVTAVNGLYLRKGAGKSKGSLCLMPKGTKVRNYGYYTPLDGVKWLLVQATVKGVTYTGFCSKAYLKK